jgi:outer membrane protein insertion porin family
MSNLSLKYILKAIFVLIFSISFYSFDLPSREGGFLSFQKAQAFSSFKVSGLEVKGNKKIEADAILGRLDLKKGGLASPKSVRKAINDIFEMGYFYDVKVNRIKKSGGNVLQFEVVEKPSVVEIKYLGNDEISDDDIAEVVDIRQYEILNRNKVRENAEKIQKLYEDKGFFLAKVTYEIEEDKDPTKGAKLSYRVQENDKVEVKKVKILGNEKLSDSFLKSRMLTQEGGFFSFFSGSGAFKQEMFDRDLQVLNLTYYNEGYVQVKVDRPEVYVTPDKKGIFITIRVEEGDQFSVGNVDFSGELLFDRDELREAIEIKDREIFSYEILEKDLSALQAKYGDLGYAFANIIPRTRFRPDEKKVDIIFEIDKGNKVYFGEISITGNSKTRDKVIRRELSIVEGELYNETKKRESLANIKRLGFFEAVNFKQSTDPAKPEILNVEISVKERNTGSLQVGAGYSSRDSFIFNAQISEQNLFGRGQKFGLNIQHSKTSSTYKLSLTEPYFRDTQWSLGGEFFQTDNLENTYRPYRDLTRGFAVRVGYPLAKFLRVYMSYRYEDVVKFEIDETEVDADLYPADSVLGITQILSGSLEYDTRDDRFSPSSGQFASVTLNHAGLGGAHNYNSIALNYKYFKKVFWDVVWRNNLVYGYIWNDGTETLPFNKLYLLGGAYTLKGYDYGSIGEVVRDDVKNEDVVFGAERQFYYNAEFEFPLVREANIKGVVFYDMGFAYTDLTAGESLNDILQKDYGFGFRWFSPIGPLRFEWGFPVNPKDYHDDRNFEFSIGTPF